MTRREAVVLFGAGVAWPVLARMPADVLGANAETGWAALDLGTGRRLSSNGAARLPMCSTFKWLLAACVLFRVDAGMESLDHQVTFGAADLLDNAPVTRAALVAAGGVRATLTVRELGAAIMSVSDNAAANLLLARVGGPAGLTAWLRAQGDPVTRLDRVEPALNAVPRGDPRDTTTAEASVGNLHRFLYGDVLRPASRAQLLDWLLSCRTGRGRFPAGLPAGWRIGHRTGTRTIDAGDPPTERAAAGDVGVLLPPRGGPILLAAFAAGWSCPLPQAEAWFAEIAENVVMRWVR